MIITVFDIPVEVYKKDIKNMHLYVKPPYGKVSISAPYSLKDETIEMFIRTKLAWIKKQVAQFENQARQSEREYVSGETLYVWGKQCYIQVIYGTKNFLELSGNKILFTVKKNSSIQQRERIVREWYRSLLKREIERVLPKWEKITGLKPENWRTKYMTTRWGSCNTRTREIWLNVQLAKKTSECLEYVLLHELIHLIEKNHNDRFIALMDKYMPRWREIKQSLNTQMLDYMVCTKTNEYPDCKELFS
ncbi:M48 family metallopeptidase [Treponema pedis]|uniref:M48 family metallopeptidase n=1 Tax=Treponema pedis TaxID=409322 RepID=A0A7S6WPN0_9SPIR|nr:SprT family zinc-dependent metalloprotease [Treponema pedis]QOW61023.1 M48 family metallopeptidase [Treponema pedis]